MQYSKLPLKFAHPVQIKNEPWKLMSSEEKSPECGKLPCTIHLQTVNVYYIAVLVFMYLSNLHFSLALRCSCIVVSTLSWKKWVYFLQNPCVTCMCTYSDTDLNGGFLITSLSNTWSTIMAQNRLTHSYLRYWILHKRCWTGVELVTGYTGTFGPIPVHQWIVLNSMPYNNPYVGYKTRYYSSFWSKFP